MFLVCLSTLLWLARCASADEEETEWEIQWEPEEKPACSLGVGFGFDFDPMYDPEEDPCADPHHHNGSEKDLVSTENGLGVEKKNKSFPLTNTSKSSSSRRQISEEAELFLTGRLSTVFIPSFYTLVFIISVPFNICAVLVFVRRIKPKNPAVVFMLNLACADLLFAAVLPFKISYHFKGNDWIFGPAMCRLVTAAFFWNMYCSVLLIACISVDRLLAVVYPMDSLTWRSPRKAVLACVAMWVVSFVGSMHILFTEQTASLKQLNITTCSDVQASELFECYKMYFIILCLLLFFLPLIITAVSYIQVIKTLNKTQPGLPDQDRKRRRAAVLASTVLVMFVICFTPTNCLFIVHQLKFNERDLVNHGDSLYIAYQVFLCLGSLNCLLDPLVYYFGSTQFQKELSGLLGRQRTTQGSSSGQSASDPSTTTSQTALKPNCKSNPPLVNSDSSQTNLCSRCKKNLI
ncbi:proteinase-activated receptor 1-like [Halichoeres trimaculatus]|uniref:proteinase-activated receptor 1-like n=1 Tax=Halichoeres trimaculatus TaxID=147232 RepID=UPI003D9EBE89